MTSPRTIVSLTRDIPPPGRDPNVALYNSIRNSSENLSFNSYAAFITALFCGDTRTWENRYPAGRFLYREILEYSTEAAITSYECLGGTHAYDAVRRATEIFVMALAAPPETCRCRYGRRS